MDSRYIQDEIVKRFDHLAEECGEFISAYSKMRRWGANSYNPELEPSERTDNLTWVMCEIEDILDAVHRIRETEITREYMNKEFPLYEA